MKIIGINGSPRIKGNSRFLMSAFMEAMDKNGHTTRVLDAVKLNVKHCIGCGNCERTGDCVFTDDDFTRLVLPALIEADLLVLSSPVYFYAFPADIKAVIDRGQVLWSRKYRFNSDELKHRDRKGVLLGVGATQGKDLFSGMEQTARYFFDAADIRYESSLLYKGMDESSAISSLPGLAGDIETLVGKLDL